VASQGWRTRWASILLALASLIGWSNEATADELIRFTYNVPGDSKPIVLHADDMGTWVDGGLRIVLLKGKVLVEHGVVQVRMQNGVVWIDQERRQKTGICWLDVYAEGSVVVENGPESRSGARAFAQVSTRGEIKLRAHDGKVAQRSLVDDPLYQRGRDLRNSQTRAPANDQVQQVAFQVETPEKSMAPEPVQTAAARPVPNPQLTEPLVPGPPAPAAVQPSLNPQPSGPLVQVPSSPGLAAPPALAAPVPGPSPATGAGPPQTVPAPPGLPPTAPSAIPVPGQGPPQGGPRSMMAGPERYIIIRPRTGAGFNPQTSPGRLPTGEYVIIVDGGVSLIVTAPDGSGLIDMVADRLVIWSRRTPQELLSGMREGQSQPGRDFEFYLSGNVEIRSQTAKENRTLRACEVYYDVGRNIAVAMQADMEFRQPMIPDPIHVRAQELIQLSPTLFKGMHAEIFSSRLPSDPGLKVYVAETTVEEKNVPRTSIFGIPVINRRTGVQEIQEQRLFESRNIFLDFENVPIFYLPFLQGDANDPLGPLESVSFNENRVFGFQFTSTFNLYNLLGIDPVPGTRWRMDVDYLSRRGPALGTNYDFTSREFFGMPATVVGTIKAYGIYDTGTDILGGFRGPDDHHPEWRGRFFFRENVQDLPAGFSLQAQVSALSDKNFLEQYWKSEFDNDFSQETFIYGKQQRDNWAWTVLAEPSIRRWVDETEWLPRADGYLIGQSFFNLFTYNVHGSAAYAHLLPTQVPPPPVEITDQDVATARLDLSQELALPFTLGPFRLAPYATLDLTYYSEDLEHQERGRLYYGGGTRASIPFTRLYPDVQSELLNLNGINHKIVFGANYFVAHSDTPYTRLPQLDQLNDNATDQALRDIKPIEPAINPAHGLFLATSPIFDPQIYAIRQLVDNRIDTLDSIEVLQLDLRQRLQTKRGYPGAEHIVDWMTLDLSASYFPRSNRDNFGENFAFLQYDWTWNIGDRTALVSSGWMDPEDQGPRVFSIGAFFNRIDRTSFYLGYRELDPLNSEAITGAVTYIFSPKYAMTFSAMWDFGINSQMNTFVFTRMGSDLQVSLGFSYNSLVNNFGVVFEIVPNIVPPSHRIPGVAALGSSPGLGR
jgi:hypothetical protein